MKKLLTLLFIIFFLQGFSQVDTIPINLTLPYPFNPIAGTNITLSGTYPNITFNSSSGGSYTFSTGLTNTSGTITNDLRIGKSGGQSIYGGTAAGDNLNLYSTSAGSPTGQINFGTNAHYSLIDNSFTILSAANSTTGGAIILQNNLSTGDYMRIEGYSGVPGIITFGANGSNSSPTAVASGGYIGLWSMRGYGSAVQNYASAYMAGKATQNWTGSANGSQLVFATTPDGSTSSAIRMTINNSGKITFNNYGSGTFTGTPTYNLSVDASGNIIETANPGGSGATAGTITWPGTLYTTPTTASYGSNTLTFAPALASQSAYTLFGRGSSSGVPSFLSSIDSNWVTGLHSQNYYNTKYPTLVGGRVDTSQLAIVPTVLQRGLGARGDTLITKAHVASYTSASTININADTTDVVSVTALAANVTFNTPTGVAYYDGQNLRIIVKDNGTTRTLSFGSGFVFSTDKPNPGSTTANKKIIFDFVRYAPDDQWLCNNITNNL